MKIKYICPFWGSDNLSAKGFIQKVVESGYDGVEVNSPDDSEFEKDILEAIKENNLAYVGQQWLEPKNETVDEYISRLETLLLKRAALKPDFINSHTGKDYFSFEDNCKVLDKCYEISEKTGIDIVHETHRGRFNFCAATTSKFIDKFPDLKLNADFSHWTNVSESMLEDQQNSVNKAIKNARYIHARVGDTQSAQVNNPFAPENKGYLDTFVGWWKKIIANANELGIDTLYICPEFGPWPYLSFVPFTNEPVADQWEVNKQMMEYLRGVLG